MDHKAQLKNRADSAGAARSEMADELRAFAARERAEAGRIRASMPDLFCGLGRERALAISEARAHEASAKRAEDRAAWLSDAAELAARVEAKASKSAGELLIELGQDRGLSWTDAASWLGVSVALVRSWRMRDNVPASGHRGLAMLAALLDQLAAAGIEDPVGWVETKLALPAGYSIRPLDLLLEEQIRGVLAIASQRETPEQVLDRIDPGWRDTRRSDFEVFEDADGVPAIRRREPAGECGADTVRTISPLVLGLLRALLAEVAGPTAQARPNIYQTAEGTIQLEWHLPDRHVEVEVFQDLHAESLVVGSQVDSCSMSGTLAEAMLFIRSALS